MLKRMFMLILLLSPLSANAALITFTDRALFEASGTIEYNYGFEDFAAGAYSFPGANFTAQGVTYTTPINTIIGAGGNTGFDTISNVFTYAAFSDVTARIDPSKPSKTLFGLDLGFVGTAGEVVFEVISNLANYSFTLAGDELRNAADSLDFFGFALTDGEFFTGFSLSPAVNGVMAPVIDNVTLGNFVAIPPPPQRLAAQAPASAVSVPEPGIVVLFIIALGYALRKTRLN